MLVTQQSVADPTRARGGVHPVDTYAHVPAGFTGDATAAIIARIEEYARGFRDRIVAKTVWNVRHIEDANPNYIEADIVTGANSRANCCSARGSPSTLYSTGTRGIYLCSAATPPGAGAHGMCGYNAALSALKDHNLELPHTAGGAS